jgi:transcriptional regulator with XRE-family HTH domain
MPKAELTTFPTWLRAERRRLGLSQTAMAEALSLSLRALQNYEGGEPVPHILIQEGIRARVADLAEEKK